VEEQAVAPQALDQALDGGVGDLAFVGDLAEGGAGEDAVEDGPEEVGSAEPVGGREGL
jgi:hypothetical protein